MSLRIWSHVDIWVFLGLDLEIILFKWNLFGFFYHVMHVGDTLLWWFCVCSYAMLCCLYCWKHVWVHFRCSSVLSLCCLVLSCLVMSCLVLSSSILSCTVLSCSCPMWFDSSFCPVLSFYVCLLSDSSRYSACLWLFNLNELTYYHLPFWLHGLWNSMFSNLHKSNCVV